nr:hypothetical protein [Pedobacter sp. ASV19]
MNLDELKGAWNAYSDRVKTTADIEEEAIAGMVREKSGSVVSRIQKSYIYGISMAGFYALCFVALILGNAFDYTYSLQFIPLLLMLACFIVVLVLLLYARAGLKRADLYLQSPQMYLDEVIKAYRKPQRFLFSLVVLVFVSSSILIPLTFLPRKLEHEDVWYSLAQVFLPLVMVAVVYLAAKRMGYLNKKQWYGFKTNLEELNKLKRLASELKD